MKYRGLLFWYNNKKPDNSNYATYIHSFKFLVVSAWRLSKPQSGADFVSVPFSSQPQRKNKITKSRIVKHFHLVALSKKYDMIVLIEMKLTLHNFRTIFILDSFNFININCSRGLYLFYY